MKNVHVFFIVYATLTFSTVFALSLLSEERIDVYVALFAVEFFIASELTSPLTSAQQRRKNIVGVIMLLVFVGIVFERIIEILGR